MNRAIETGGVTAGRESDRETRNQCSKAAGRFETDAERQHLREMFTQYSDGELQRVIAELEQIIRQRDSLSSQVQERSQAFSA